MKEKYRRRGPHAKVGQMVCCVIKSKKLDKEQGYTKLAIGSNSG